MASIALAQAYFWQFTLQKSSLLLFAGWQKNKEAASQKAQ